MEEFIKKNRLKAPSFHPYFEEALNRMVEAGGKRFRPNLLLKVVEAYAPLLVEGAKQVAYAIELLHTYSLIHDDLPMVDNGELRRGIPTLHRSYDEVTALLVGDGLNTHAFYLIATAPLHNDVKVELVKILAENGGIQGMVLGQAIDCYFEGKKLNLEELKFLHLHKTGKLIAGSLQMGAVIVGRPQLGEKLYQFGLKLGLLFQIQDDLLDLLSEEETGKSSGVDENKNTFVTLLGVEGARREADKLAEELEGELKKMEPPLRKKLEELLEKYLYRHRKRNLKGEGEK
jgi:farnesyl diphosphate synthase